ncbi:vitamin K-dependent protein Z-like [Stegostoma tigrinum]|uniref:vitamin K-dependent protein Z-like n=1 Tax=Stegostoma tigrinum TaxID=3053191 RepID=UPI00202B748A|nr:vitamin K-dependent protein Z-like [Stegostoma tigrinum]
MTPILTYGIISLLFFNCQANDLFVQKSAATQFLPRFRRANWWRLSEILSGNLEKECCEETCSKEEAREVFENDKITEIFWHFYSHGNNSHLLYLLENASKIVEEQMKIYELKKELTEKKQEIHDLQDQLVAKLESCVDDK